MLQKSMQCHYNVYSLKISVGSVSAQKHCCHCCHPRSLCNNSSRRSTRLCVVGDLSLSGSRFFSGKPLNLYWVPTGSFILPKVHATAAETDQPKWWEKNAGPNMIDIHSTQEFLDALSETKDRLVIVEFYGTWCASCRALFPKICKIAEEHPEILFLKINFDENKSLCKSLNVKVLPYFHFYRGADGLVESFSCSLAKLQKLKDLIAANNRDQCSESPLEGNDDGSIAPRDKQSDITSSRQFTPTCT